MVAAFALTGLVEPEFALATVHSPQNARDTLDNFAGGTYSGVPESDSERSVDAAWTARALEATAGFTETAMASDPNPVRQPGETDLPSDEASLSPDEPPSHAKVPEPAALMLFGTALIGIAHAARKKSKR